MIRPFIPVLPRCLIDMDMCKHYTDELIFRKKVFFSFENIQFGDTADWDTHPFN